MKILITLFFSSLCLFGYSQKNSSETIPLLITENHCIYQLFAAVSEIENYFDYYENKSFYVMISTRNDTIIQIIQSRIGLIFQFPLYGAMQINNSIFYIDSSASFLFSKSGVRLLFLESQIYYDYGIRFDDSTQWGFLFKNKQLFLVDFWSVLFSEKDWTSYSTRIDCFASPIEDPPSKDIHIIDIIEEPADPFPFDIKKN